MPPLKDELGPAAARRLAQEMSVAWPGFPTRRFLRGLAAQLEDRELMDRNNLLAERLAQALPAPFRSAADVLWHAIESPTFTGWLTQPCGTFVATAGLEDPGVALPLLAGLTPRWSSEFAVRPFIEHHPVVAYRHLEEWCAHPDEHVRRLVSEGTRPRLPWAARLKGLVVDPSPNLPLLDALVDDASAYVRRSVANHLNDISKDHPHLALDLARRWQHRSEEAAWAVNHGLRSLVKRGDAEALELIGATPAVGLRLLDFSVDSQRVTVGESVALTFSLMVDGDVEAEAVIDYRVHYVGVRGVNKPKVFKLARRQLQPGCPVTISRLHRFEHVSVRQIHPGPHTIDLQVNGRILGSVTVDVR